MVVVVSHTPKISNFGRERQCAEFADGNVSMIADLAAALTVSTSTVDGLANWGWR